MKKIKYIFELLALITVIIVISMAFLCWQNITKKNSDLSTVNSDFAGVSNFAESYLKTMQSEGTEISVQYTYFKAENDFIRTAYIDDKTALLNYEIMSIDKINHYLYAITYSYERESDTGIPGEKDTGVAYNYVANIDGEYALIVNANDIPDDLRKNFDPSQYRYDDEDILDSENIFEVEFVD